METLIEITSHTFKLDLLCHTQLFGWIAKIRNIEYSHFKISKISEVK